jgi:hypothetical protein
MFFIISGGRWFKWHGILLLHEVGAAGKDKNIKCDFKIEIDWIKSKHIIHMPNLIIVDLYIKAPQESLTMPITINIIIWQFLFYLWHGLVKIVTNRHNRMVKKHPGPCVFHHCFYLGPHLLRM